MLAEENGAPNFGRRDLDFPVNWLNKNKLWFLPYALHLGIALAIGFGFHTWLLAACYWFGIMSHPIQGWMVNAFGHHSGYRNFNTPDNSKNNVLVALFVMGEGYQNNHHYLPQAARFGVRWWEVDMGYWLCQLARFLAFSKSPPRPLSAPSPCGTSSRRQLRRYLWQSRGSLLRLRARKIT